MTQQSNHYNNEQVLHVCIAMCMCNYAPTQSQTHMWVCTYTDTHALALQPPPNKLYYTIVHIDFTSTPCSGRGGKSQGLGWMRLFCTKAIMIMHALLVKPSAMKLEGDLRQVACFWWLWLSKPAQDIDIKEQPQWSHCRCTSWWVCLWSLSFFLAGW